MLVCYWCIRFLLICWLQLLFLFLVVYLLFQALLALCRSLFVFAYDFATESTLEPRLFTRLQHVLEGFPPADALLGPALHPAGDL